MNVSEAGIQKLHHGHQQSLILPTRWVNLEKPTKNKKTEKEGDLGLKGICYSFFYIIADLKTYLVMFINFTHHFWH